MYSQLAQLKLSVSTCKYSLNVSCFQQKGYHKRRVSKQEQFRAFSDELPPQG